MFHIDINGIKFSAETADKVIAIAQAFQSAQVIEGDFKPNENTYQPPHYKRVHRRVIGEVIEASEEAAEIASRALSNAADTIHRQFEFVAATALEQIWNLTANLGAGTIKKLERAVRAAERRKQLRPDRRAFGREPPIQR
jgi:hypothetical protein